MPLYEGECRKGCGRFEVVLKLAEYLEKRLVCPECGEGGRTVIAPNLTVGPMPSKPQVIDQIGQTFTSRAEERRYFAAHPGRMVVAPNDSAFINHRDQARSKADAKAKQIGYRDHDDRTQKQKADHAHRTRISQGERKISNIA